MAIVKVQGPTIGAGGGSTHSISKTYGSNVTAGNLLVALCSSLAGGSSTGSVSDTLNGSWTVYGSWHAGASSLTSGGIFYFANTAGGSAPTVTLTVDSGDDYPEIVLYEFSGVAATLLTDGSLVSATGNSAAPASGTLTTTNANDLLVALATSSSATGVSAGTGGSWQYTTTTNGNGAEYNIVSSATGYNATFTAQSGAWWAAIGAFKQAAGGVITPGASGTITVSATTFVVRYPNRPKPTGTITTSGVVVLHLNPIYTTATGTITTSGAVHPSGPVRPTALGALHITSAMTQRNAIRAPITAQTITVTGAVQARLIFAPKASGASTVTGTALNPHYLGIIRPGPLTGSIVTSGLAHGNLRVEDLIVVTVALIQRNAIRAPVNAPILTSGTVTAKLLGTARVPITGLITTSGTTNPRLIGQVIRPTAIGTISTNLNNTLIVEYSAGVYLPTAIGSIATSGTTLVTRYLILPGASGTLEMFGQANATNALRLSPLLTGSIQTSSTTLNAGRYLYPRSQGLSQVTSIINARQSGEARIPISGSIGLSGVLMVGIQPTRLQVNAKAIAILSSYLNVNLIPSHVNPILITVDVPGYYVVEDAAGCFVVLYLIPGIIYNWIVQVIREGPYPDYQTALAQLMLLASNSYA